MARRLSTPDWRLCTAVLRGVARSGGRHRVPCPLCERTRGKSDTKESLYLHADGGFVCFRCGAAGFMPGATPRQYTAPQASTTAAVWQRPPDGFTLLYDGEGMLDPRFGPHRTYLETESPKGRGLDPNVARFSYVGGILRPRPAVVVPVLDPTGKYWQGWVARDLHPTAGWSPYRYPQGMPWHTYLYGQDILGEASSFPAFVVEGVFDRMALYPHGVATLGKPTGNHIAILARSKRPVVFCPDGDAWGPAEWHAYTLRLVGVRSGAIRLPPRVDPDEVLRDDVFDYGLLSLDQQDAVRLGAG